MKFKKNKMLIAQAQIYFQSEARGHKNSKKIAEIMRALEITGDTKNGRDVIAILRFQNNMMIVADLSAGGYYLVDTSDPFDLDIAEKFDHSQFNRARTILRNRKPFKKLKAIQARNSGQQNLFT